MHQARHADSLAFQLFEALDAHGDGVRDGAVDTEAVQLDAAEPEPPAPEPNTRFEQVLTAFEDELRAGHFSKLDVYAEHEQAASAPDAPRMTRSDSISAFGS